ncbi:CHRD domain-containing protein [Synechococcales cyanobacterium CNB]|nr:hypothetical protein [cyanobacterium CYA1]MDL1904315.1 CHRD domain-containing protein [Synechococcales cyanobacterium CNB]
MPISSAMIAITTSNSISVNACLECLFIIMMTPGWMDPFRIPCPAENPLDTPTRMSEYRPIPNVRNPRNHEITKNPTREPIITRMNARPNAPVLNLPPIRGMMFREHLPPADLRRGRIPTMKSLVPAALLSTLAVGVAHAHTWHYYFAMTARQVVTGSDSAAKGIGVLHYNHHNLRADLELFISGLTLDDLLPHGPNGTPIHFHDAPNQQEGPIVTDLGWWGSFVQEQGGIRLTLSQFYLGGQQGQIYSDFGEVEYALYTNTIYAQVYTKQHPLGELRGQLIDRRNFNTYSGIFEKNGFTVFGPVPAPSSAAVLGIAALGCARRRRSRG